MVKSINLRTLPLLASLILSLTTAAADSTDQTQASDDGLAKATFAGGCFWCMEHPFDELDGVVSTTSGYSGGQTPNPDYKAVSAGGTGHAEVVQVLYDPDKIAYAELLEVFWRNVDPLTANAQFCDYGDQYRTAIFFHDDLQHELAEGSKRSLEESNRFADPVVTEITAFENFFSAEDYHQVLLQQKSRPLQVLPLQVRSRPTFRKTLG